MRRRLYHGIPRSRVRGGGGGELKVWTKECWNGGAVRDQPKSRSVRWGKQGELLRGTRNEMQGLPWKNTKIGGRASGLGRDAK